jgi:hypothetical protein
MTHMSNDYWFFKPGAGTTTLDVDVDFRFAVTSPRATLLSFNAGGGIVEQEVALDASGDTNPPVSVTFDSTVAKVVIVVTNASTRFTQCGSDQRAPFFSCFGKPLDDSTSKNYKLDLSAP